ncbi:MAG: O-antigen ligase family protein [Anaerolineae bacterium]
MPSDAIQARSTYPQPLRRLLLWLVVFSLTVGATLWLAVHIRQQLTAYPGRAPTVWRAADKSYGVTARLDGLKPAEIEHALDRMASAHLLWVRLPFPWALIEPQRGLFDWSHWDYIVAAVTRHNIRILALLDTTPQWARPPGSPLHTPPMELSDFGTFAQALAQRYGAQIDAYQIWDEPNLSTHWGERYVEPRSYARLLREAAIAIRAVDPDAAIVTAALAPTIERGPLNLNEMDFLEQLYQANAAQWFDVVAAQPYGFRAAPDEPTAPDRLNFARLTLLRRVMERHGDHAKAVWMTSFGWSVLPPDWQGDASPWPSVSPEDQERYTAQAIALARATWPWLGPMFFPVWDAQWLAPSDPRRGLALVDGEQALKPLNGWHTSGLFGDVATVGSYPAAHPSGQREGAWRSSPDGVDVPRYPPAVLTIYFEGTRLDLLVRRGEYRGLLSISVDAQPANQLPQQDGRAYLWLFDPLEEEVEITVARYLPDGRHQATIVAEGGWYQWPLIGWRVSREADMRLLGVGLAAAGASVLVALSGTLWALRRLNWRAWIVALGTWYAMLGTSTQLALLLGATAAFYFAPGTLLSLALLLPLFLCLLPRPDLGLAVIIFSVPFFLLPKPLLGRTIALSEVLLVLVAGAFVVRRVWRLLLTRQPPSKWDWMAWILVGLGGLGALATVFPPADPGWLAEADWSLMPLMLLPLAGVLAVLAGVEMERWHLSPVWQLDAGLGALVLLALISSLAAPNVGVAFHEFHVVVWDAAIFYVFIRRVEHEMGRFSDAYPKEMSTCSRWLVDAFWLGATAMAVYALYLFFFTEYAITAEGVHRALGSYGSPNNLALLLERAAPVLIAQLALGWKRSPGITRPRVDPILRLLALAFLSSTLVLTFSRGALLLGMPAALLFIAALQGRRVLGVMAAALAALVGGVLPLLGTKRLNSLFDTNAGTGFFRLRLWQSAGRMLLDRPWLGVGPDNFLYQYRTRYMLPDAWQEPNLSHPHNIVLDFATRLGILGVAVLVWIQIAFWRSALSLYRQMERGHARATLLGLMASMMATLAHGLVDHAFFLVDLAFIFSLIAAIVANEVDRRQKSAV